MGIRGCNSNCRAALTHPDIATLVAPLCRAKRVKKNKKPSLPLAEERGDKRSKYRVSPKDSGFIQLSLDLNSKSNIRNGEAILNTIENK